MLASLPKLADRTFLVGFLLPVLVAALAAAWLFGATDELAVALQGEAEGMTTVAVAFVFLVWTVATLLLVLNYWTYRLMEGYIGPFNDAARRRGQETRWRARKAVRDAARAAAGQGDQAQRKAAAAAYVVAARELAADYPHRAELLLPTRFGNTVRAFESYPLVAYGVDSIPMWIRLQGVMKADAQSAVADARSRVDFFVNLWFLSLLLAASAAAKWLYEGTLGWTGAFQWQAPAMLCGATVLAWLSYEGAVAVASAWGDAVKSAFDLHLPALARQLGYRIPAEPERMRAFWQAVNERCLYWRPMDSRQWPMAELPSAPPSGAAAVEEDEQD